jgi:DNA repair protein RadA/Sms
VDRNRLALVLAVLARHGGLSLGSSDVFVSVAGGVRVDEPGADLAVALALASAARGAPLAEQGRPLAAFGELGLTGELRDAPHAERRLAEARKFGLGRVMYPGEGTGTLRAALGAALGGAPEAARAA